MRKFLNGAQRVKVKGRRESPKGYCLDYDQCLRCLKMQELFKIYTFCVHVCFVLREVATIFSKNSMI